MSAPLKIVITGCQAHDAYYLRPALETAGHIVRRMFLRTVLRRSLNMRQLCCWQWRAICRRRLPGFGKANFA
jgi:hypothetical protein